jgi:ribonuclease HI
MQGARAGVLLLTPSGEQFKYMVHLDFKVTNNMAEYESLIFGLSAALSLGVRQLLVKGDSQLIMKQVNGECSCNDPQLITYLLHVQKVEKDFEVLDLHHVPRADNAVTDDLSTKASTWAPVPDGVFGRRLLQSTARPAEQGEGGKTSTLKLAVPTTLFSWSPPRIVGVTRDSVHPDVQDSDTQAGPDAWMMEIWDYLKDNILPDKHVSTEQICWYPVDQVSLHTSFKSRHGVGRAPTRCHMSYSTGPCLQAKVGSGGATCLAAPEPASLIGRALTPPRVPWLWTHWEGSGTPRVL